MQIMDLIVHFKQSNNFIMNKVAKMMKKAQKNLLYAKLETGDCISGP
jgi:hypothetical protein